MKPFSQRHSLPWFAFFIALSLIIPAVYGRSGQTGQPAKPPEASAGKYPKDVYPDSRNRLPLRKREDLDEEGKKSYDRQLSDPNSLARLQGPGGIRLWSSHPAGGSDYLRFHNPIGRRLSELSILVAAREVNSAFEWYAHEPEAERQGLETSIIDVVRNRQPLTNVGEKEAMIIQIGREWSKTRQVSSDTFARALKIFGPGNLIDMVSLMGQYAGSALLLATFDQQVPAEVPADARSRLPIP
jgi:4-carboxymuconolactone decarboxylase